tara:strand:- start:2241 stop:3875 length:1635 start_codon:yes stop_codon:yes gene_type:complete
MSAAEEKANKIAKRLREDRVQKLDQVKQLQEQLAIVDAIIDEYDELINKLDVKIPPLIAPINVKIKAVETAYHNRISHGCRSDMKWVLQETKALRRFGSGSNMDVQIYECVKDPDTYQDIGYYGAKYWKYPKNREYGSNVVEIIDNADANVGSGALIIYDSDAETLTGFTTGVTAGIATGDFITDALQDAVIFQLGNTPTVVGLGTTSYPGKAYAVSGFCTAGTTRIYEDGNIGFITNFSVGDHVYGASDRSGDGVVAPNTKITGFGTAVGIVSYTTQNGIQSSTSIVLSYADVDKPLTSGIAATEGHNFYVGVVSTYYFASLDKTPTQTGLSSSFLVVRPPDTGDITFESTKNPVDPVEIGIAKGSNIGKGHKLILTNNKQPDIVAQWSEVKQEPEPAVGAGKVEYWVGTTNWPVYYPYDADGSAVDPIYASLGHQIIIAIGGTANTTMGYENTPPSGSIPGDCGTYDTAIATATDEMLDQIALSTPKINHYINGAASLREIRNEDETQAWGYMQGIGYMNEKRSDLEKRANSVEDFNWKEIT